MNYRHLYWGTVADNAADRLIDKTERRGEMVETHKLAATDVRSIRAEVANGAPKGATAARYGVSPSAVSDILARRTWAWLD